MNKNESLESKKLAIIRILQILNKYTDENHLLKHSEIVNLLNLDYGIEIERKAVGRNISLLKEAGYEIETTKNGSYLVERLFEDSELKLLIDSVLSSKHISAKHSKDLINKLSNLSNKYFKTCIKNVYSINDWNKTDNASLFYNIEIIDESIEKRKQIKFDYNKYGSDKKLHKTTTHYASACQLILHNQRYFLMAINEKWHNIGHYRLDKITNIELTDINSTNIRSLKEYKNGINYKELSSAFPYMFTDTPQKIILLTEEWMIDQLIDWFGFDISIVNEKNKYKVSFKASVKAMEYWTMQYLNNVEIIEPIQLREKIIKNINNAKERYT